MEAELLSLQEVIDGLNLALANLREKSKEDMITIEDSQLLIRSLNQNIDLGFREKDQLLKQINDFKNVISKVEGQRDNFEDELFTNKGSVESLSKDLKDYKDKYFQMQDYISRMNVERAARNKHVDALELKLLELEAIIGKFGSIQE